MPVFSAIDRLRWIKNRKLNPLNRCCLMNVRLNYSLFSTGESTGARKCCQELLRSVRRNQVKHLDVGRYVRHGWYQLTTQCQISWPTSMAALSGIPAHPALEWSLTALQTARSESQNGLGARTTMSPSTSRCWRQCNVPWGLRPRRCTCFQIPK